MNDRDFILKLARRYSKEEVVKALLLEIGKMKSEIQEHELKNRRAEIRKLKGE